MAMSALHWKGHFTKILNLQSEFDMEELQRVQQRPYLLDLKLRNCLLRRS